VLEAIEYSVRSLLNQVDFGFDIVIVGSSIALVFKMLETVKCQV